MASSLIISLFYWQLTSIRFIFTLSHSRLSTGHGLAINIHSVKEIINHPSKMVIVFLFWQRNYFQVLLVDSYQNINKTLHAWLFFSSYFFGTSDVIFYTFFSLLYATWFLVPSAWRWNQIQLSKFEKDFLWKERHVFKRRNVYFLKL